MTNICSGIYKSFVIHVSPINCIVIIENDLFLYIEVLMYVLNNFVIIINTTRLRLIGKITLDQRKYMYEYMIN